MRQKKKSMGELWAEESDYLSIDEVSVYEIMRQNGYKNDMKTKMDRKKFRIDMDIYIQKMVEKDVESKLEYKRLVKKNGGNKCNCVKHRSQFKINDISNDCTYYRCRSTKVTTAYSVNEDGKGSWKWMKNVDYVSCVYGTDVP